MRKFIVLALVLVAAVGAFGASGDVGYPGTAGIVAIGYKPDEQSAAHLGARSVADSTSVAALTSAETGEIAVLGKPNLNVSARFTAASQTCAVRILRLHKTGSGSSAVYKVLGISSAVTLTGTSFTDLTTNNYIGEDSVFDTGGATHVRIVLTTGPASGSVTFWAGTF